MATNMVEASRAHTAVFLSLIGEIQMDSSQEMSWFDQNQLQLV